MYYGEKQVERPIRWGMVGGGQGAQIGYIHRASALRDFNFELVAGAFDINPERGKAFGANLHVAPERCYPDYKTMFAEECARPDGIQAVSIATPNFTHFEIAKAALEAGLHVYCEKPMCFTIAEAEELEALVKKTGKIMFVSYGYAGHQMIEQARKMIAGGDLGAIRIINMQFAHGYHNVAVEKSAASTAWRVDPKKAGPSYVMGDVGTHPLYLEVQGEPQHVLHRDMGYLKDGVNDMDRIGAGHPEGLFEAWANLYARFAQAIDRRERGEAVDFWYPDVHAGVLGVKWVAKCVESADQGSVWVDYN